MPLLLLLLIARAEAGEPGEVSFREIERRLQPLLESFGPKNPTEVHYPFWHLANNEAGIWNIPRAGEMAPGKSNKRPALSEFRGMNPEARAPQPFWDALREDSQLRSELTRRVLAEFWPETLHGDIVKSLGFRRVPRWSARWLQAMPASGTK